MTIIFSIVSFLVVLFSASWTFLTFIVGICLFLVNYAVKFPKHWPCFSLNWRKVEGDILSKRLLTVVVLELILLNSLLIVFHNFLRLRVQNLLGNLFEKGNDLWIFLQYDELNCINTYQIIWFTLLIFLKVPYDFIIEILETMHTIIINSETCFELDSHIKGQQSYKLFKVKSLSLMQVIVVSKAQINLFWQYI